MTATLHDVNGVVAGRLHGDGDVVVTGATHDSRVVERGFLFCCVPGANVDGHDFAPRALDAGAAALLVERSVTDAVPEILVADVRSVMGLAAAEVHDRPSDELTVIGVTGTNGKSSVVQLVADIWTAAGHRPEVYGTLTGARTTPEATELQQRLRASCDRRTDTVALEVSSHALALSRVAGTRFAAAIFTNLGHDHLDFHGDMASYFEAKASFFTPDHTDLAIVNRDDAWGARLAERVASTPGVELVTYGLDDATDLLIDGPTSRFTWRGHTVDLQLAGLHNVANALAAATAAASLGLDTDVIADALCATVPVRGRFELIDVGQGFTLAVDYAHTPDALGAVLGAARQVTAGRVIAVFGCGGDRDQEKRPEMGAVVDLAADVAVVTSDNPRHEDPQAIIDAVVAGMSGGPGGGPRSKVLVEPDRRTAIAVALSEARAGDVVLIAGKGHETVQQVGDQELPFDDRQVALEELGALA